MIYNLTSYHQYALKYNSHGFYSNFSPIGIDNKFRTKTQASNYLGSSFQTFDNNQYKINNLFRPDYVAVSTEEPIIHNYTLLTPFSIPSISHNLAPIKKSFS